MKLVMTPIVDNRMATDGKISGCTNKTLTFNNAGHIIQLCYANTKAYHTYATLRRGSSWVLNSPGAVTSYVGDSFKRCIIYVVPAMDVTAVSKKDA